MYLNFILTILVITLITIIALIIYWWVKFGKKLFNIFLQFNSLKNKQSFTSTAFPYSKGNTLDELNNVINIVNKLKK